MLYKLFFTAIFPTVIVILKRSNANDVIGDAMTANTVLWCPCILVERTIGKVVSHVCGRSTYSNTKLSLILNRVRNDKVEWYLLLMVAKCVRCCYTSLHASTRKSLLSSLIQVSNELVQSDHFYLHGVYVFQVMDSITRLPLCEVVSGTALQKIILTFESLSHREWASSGYYQRFLVTSHSTILTLVISWLWLKQSSSNTYPAPAPFPRVWIANFLNFISLKFSYDMLREIVSISIFNFSKNTYRFSVASGLYWTIHELVSQSDCNLI